MLKKLFCAFSVALAGVVFSFVPALAADIQEITPDPTAVSSSLTLGYSCGNKSGYVSAYETSTRSDLYNLYSRIGVGGPLITAFQVHQAYSDNISYLPLTDIVFESYNYGNGLPIYINQCNYEFDYLLPQLSGWFEVTYDIYLGVTINQIRGNANTLTNSFVTDSEVDNYSDQYGHYFSIWYVDDDTEVQWMSGANPQVSNLLHFKATYIGAATPDPLELNLAAYIADHISSWSASGAYGNGYEYAFYMFQAATELTVNYMSTPPATPTPIPTPYPGQDTQESINQGVQVIVNALDISATPIPQPTDLEIDSTIFDELESLTLPDINDQEVTRTYTSLWNIFNPLWSFIGIAFGSLFVVGVFLYLIRGQFI